MAAVHSDGCRQRCAAPITTKGWRSGGLSRGTRPRSTPGDLFRLCALGLAAKLPPAKTRRATACRQANRGRSGLDLSLSQTCPVSPLEIDGTLIAGVRSLFHSWTLEG